MKSLVTVLVDIDHTLELLGVFPGTRAAMEYIWSQQVGREFDASPIGDTDGNHVGVRFIENMAEISLRKAAAPNLRGLGPMNYHSVWIRQQDMEGPLGMFVAEFAAADEEKTYGPGDLRWAMVEGVLTFVHLHSAFGQHIEEKRMTLLANNVQKTMLAPRATLQDMASDYALNDAVASARMHDVIGTALGPPKQEPEEPQVDDFICEYCETAAVPGAIFPIAANGMTDHAYVEVCDVCRIFELDTQAAKAVGVVFGKRVKISDDGRPYLEGVDFHEATALAKSKQRECREAQI